MKIDNTTNLPPFYVGQRVVALKTSPGNEVVKNEIYTVSGCVFVDEWYVGLKEFPSDIDRFAGQKTGLYYRGGPANFFAPITESFESITYKEVIKIESPLISVQ